MSSNKRLRYEGINFSTTQQRKRFEHLFETRDYMHQKFAHIPTLQQLGIYRDVRTLFSNIGWSQILDLNFWSYLKPTAEFLSSVNLDHAILKFRLNSTQFQISENDVSGIISATTENTFNCQNNIHMDGYNSAGFWGEITKGEIYKPKGAKAARIVHPSLRVAHRILASVVFPREEKGTVNSQELLLLYCMTRNFPLKPHFGSYICTRLAKLGATNSGTIVCGGLVTMLARRVGTQFPPDTDTVLGDPHLDMGTLEGMKMFTAKDDGEDWVLYKDIKFFADGDTIGEIAIANPTRLTDWSLLALTEPQEDEEEEEEEEEEEDEPQLERRTKNRQDRQHPQQHQGQSSTQFQGQSSSQPQYQQDPNQYPPYHQQYLTHFQNLENFQTRFENRFNSFQTTFDNRFDAFQTRTDNSLATLTNESRQHQAAQNRERERMWEVITGIENWAITQHGYQPPQPPPQ